MNKFMVWQDGYYMTQMLESRVERLGTLTDRDYLITRHGLKGQQKVTRDLDGEDPSPIDADVFFHSTFAATSGVYDSTKTKNKQKGCMGNHG